jgi:hypothetical protein
LAALKWFDMVTPSAGLIKVAIAPGLSRAKVQQRGVDLAGAGPGDGMRAAPDHGELDGSALIWLVMACAGR